MSKEWKKDRWTKAMLKADSELNVGMPLELMAAEGYAEHDGMSPEAYVVALLRRERVRRQEEDRVVRDRALLDEEIDKALAQGLTVQASVTKSFNDSKFSNGATHKEEDLSRDFLDRVATRLIERARDSA